MATYTVTEREGCRLVDGEVPLSAFAALASGMPTDAVFDPHAARLLNVKIAMGRPCDLERLCESSEVKERARAAVDREHPQLSPEAREWLALGFHGVSSLTIMARLVGAPRGVQQGAPRDPADFARCRLLLEQVPELRARLGEMGSVSEAWAGLVENWEALESLMDQEAPLWRNGSCRAPRTHARMRALGC